VLLLTVVKFASRLHWTKTLLHCREKAVFVTCVVFNILCVANFRSDLVVIGFTDAAILDEQILGVLGKCGAVRILKGVQSVSKGVRSFCGYPNQAR
jgi:hypothetical protein